MNILKRIERGVSNTFLRACLVRRYGTTHPTMAKLYGCDHSISINPRDPCAVKKVLKASIRGRVPDDLVFWRDFNAHLSPDLAVDVGTSYGECLFGTRYAEHTELHGFEANPQLIPHLQESLRHHPDGKRMQVTHCVASQQSGEDQTFIIDLDWSEMSSVVANAGEAHRCEKTSVPARAIDDVIPESSAKNRRLLFKIDIEGYEYHALQGFSRTLDTSSLAVGLLEYDTEFSNQAGVDNRLFLSWLQERFQIFLIRSLAEKVLQPLSSTDEAARMSRADSGFHRNLVLVTQDTTEDWLPPHWSIEAHCPDP